MRIDAGKMATMPAMCKTCPFQRHGDKGLEAKVQMRVLNASQICHGTEGPNREPRFLCRGARLWQVGILHRLGFLEEPTDECFRATSARVLGKN